MSVKTEVVEKIGSPGRSRTCDILINSSVRGAGFSMISGTSECKTMQIAARDATQAQPRCGPDEHVTSMALEPSDPLIKRPFWDLRTDGYDEVNARESEGW